MKIMKSKNIAQNNKGITIIALVITIIVLIILAGVTINSLFNANGIFNQSQYASNQYEIESIKEQLYIVNSEYTTERAKDSSINREWFFEKLIENKIVNSKDNIGTPEKNNTEDIYTIVTNKGYEITIIVDQNENIIIGEIIKIGGVQQLAERLNFKEENVIVEPGQTQKLEIEITPDNTSNKKLNWTSSDEKVATVKDGIVTAIKEGTTTIAAITTDGSNLTASITITVKNLSASEKLGYASEGLILHYDGIQNTREGHNAQATVWEDLSRKWKRCNTKWRNMGRILFKFKWKR